jgi:hypothetical protein
MEANLLIFSKLAFFFDRNNNFFFRLCGLTIFHRLTTFEKQKLVKKWTDAEKVFSC